ncbi:integrase, catalytic region, zinc finger, CCHC-type containing protein [Tanacetum coccineum]
MIVVGIRETVGSPVVQQNGIQCFNCKGFGHYAKECRKPDRDKTTRSQGKDADVQTSLFWHKIQEVLPEESSSTEQPLEQTIDYEILQTKLNDTLGLLALKDIEIKEGLKTKAYEISVLNQKHDELVKKSLLTKSQLEGYLKEKTKVILDLKVKEEKDIDKMIEMDKQLKFLNEIDLKAQMQDKNIAISELKKHIEKCKGKSVETQFDKPSVVRQPNAQRIPKPSVLGKPTPFSNSHEM